MSELPKLTRNDHIVLEKIRKQNIHAFYSNVTPFLISEMIKYLRDSRVWRISVMGETRSGKSEVASTLAFLYAKYFNIFLKEGVYEHMDIWEMYPKKEIKFDVPHVMASQSDYINNLRDSKTQLNFGQVWQIDESRTSIGGVGSFSETIDLENLNNIIAKFMQSEIWVTPLKFETRNAPYGIYQYKKDTINRVNWGLLFKIEMNANSSKSVHFLGWVKIPLHKNEDFRKEYNAKKNEWIKEVISGGGDKRMEMRKKCAKLLSEDEKFSRLSTSGKTFIFNKTQQLSILEQFIIDGKTQNWNELERYRIVDEARMIVMEAKSPFFGDDNVKM